MQISISLSWSKIWNPIAWGFPYNVYLILHFMFPESRLKKHWKFRSSDVSTSSFEFLIVKFRLDAEDTKDRPQPDYITQCSMPGKCKIEIGIHTRSKNTLQTFSIRIAATLPPPPPTNYHRLRRPIEHEPKIYFHLNGSIFYQFSSQLIGKIWRKISRQLAL